jgi:predicted nucleotidyltransferase
MARVKTIGRKMIVTLAQRKEARVAQIRSDIERLRTELADYARQAGGRFWLYGSAATGDLHYDSDVDILVDFEPKALTEALTFAEEACRRHGLKPDVKPKSWCTDAFIGRIASQAVVLS